MAKPFNNLVFYAIGAGQTDTIPLPSTALSGTASFDGSRLTLKDVVQAEVSKIKKYDGIVVGNALFIVDHATYVSGGAVNIKIMKATEGFGFPGTFVDQTFRWAKGNGWSDFPSEWSVYGVGYARAGLVDIFGGTEGLSKIYTEPVLLNLISTTESGFAIVESGRASIVPIPPEV
jgi:hypothetical protein